MSLEEPQPEPKAPAPRRPWRVDGHVSTYAVPVPGGLVMQAVYDDGTRVAMSSTFVPDVALAGADVIRAPHKHQPR